MVTNIKVLLLAFLLFFNMKTMVSVCFYTAITLKLFTFSTNIAKKLKNIDIQRMAKNESKIEIK